MPGAITATKGAMAASTHYNSASPYKPYIYTSDRGERVNNNENGSVESRTRTTLNPAQTMPTNRLGVGWLGQV